MGDLVQVETEEKEQKHSVLQGKYELGRVLGQGTFARVYHARNLQTGESVAMKVIPKEKLFKAGRSMVDQIKREISVMKSVKHPNIVELYEVMATKSKIYLAMELVRGGELFAKVKKGGRLDEDLARFYFSQLISAVDFCHSRGVYHRDLKLENLLLDDQGRLKITDFGLSTFLAERQDEEQMLHTSCGTPHYVAPEVVSRKAQGYQGSKADIWSCGVILFVLLAGYLPFHDDNLIRMYRKIYKGDFNCPPWFSSEASNLVTRMLDPNPCTRISIPQIKESAWYNINITSTAASKPFPKLSHPDDEDEDDDEGKEDGESSDKPFSVSKDKEEAAGKTLNAFHLISMSQGLDLSPLFDDKSREERQDMKFATAKPTSTVISRLKQVAAGKLKVLVKNKTKDGELLVKLRGQEDGRKGRLGIAARIYSVSPALQVVELNKDNGDTLEYNKFCDNYLRPALRDIVWTS
uniref:non-specific serine/threonine protein kinase n=1 Tax=Opuntia streptacantha TaxID=393608 RepID=A0A7C9A2F7_OPUST